MVIDKAEVVGELTDLRQNVSRVSETVTDGDSLETSDGAVVVLSFSQDFLSDGWSVLASVAFTEDVERMVILELELVQTARLGQEEFLESVVEVVSNT